MRSQFGIHGLMKLCSAVALGVTAISMAGCSSEEATASSSAPVDPKHNKIVLTSQDEILWNGRPVTLDELEANLLISVNMPEEPELQFEPEPGASYQFSAMVLNKIKVIKITKFGFVGNEKFSSSDESQNAGPGPQGN